MPRVWVSVNSKKNENFNLSGIFLCFCLFLRIGSSTEDDFHDGGDACDARTGKLARGAGGDEDVTAGFDLQHAGGVGGVVNDGDGEIGGGDGGSKADGERGVEPDDVG